MESCETLRDNDAEIRKLLEARREARRQKLLTRLGRNLTNPLNVSSLEAITGTLKSKKTPAKTAFNRQSKEDISIKEENVSVKEENVSVQGNSVNKKPQLKKALSFRQTITSQKRSDIANAGSSSLKRATSFKHVPSSVSKPVTQAVKTVQNVKQKLTVPYSPNFSVRTRPSVRPPPPIAKPNATLPNTAKKAVKPQLTKAQATSSPQPRAVDSTDSTKRRSTSWMIPLTPEKTTTSNSVSSPRTPNVKPFVRKSFSESKTMPKRSTTLGRSDSNAAMARPSSTLLRKSVAPSTFGNESRLSRSVWSIPKEPTEKEKVQQWLEKRGRSASSCRHLGCLGHQLKDFEVQEQKSTVRKSIRAIRTPILPKSIPRQDASPQLKRNVSILNTTFEKEDEIEEEELIAPPPPPAFKLDPEELVDPPIIAESVSAETILEEESVDKFHTPIEIKEDSSLASELQEDRVEKLLETIAELFQVPNYPSTKLEDWIVKSEASFPEAIKTNALYWDIKARLEERRGNPMEALDIYKEALNHLQNEALDCMKQLYENFLLRIGSNMPTGEGTPLLKSLGVETPMIRQSRRLTAARRPLLDAKQAFNSTTVKYELKLKQVFESVGKTTKENASAVPKRRSMRTPLKFTAASNIVSVTSEGSFQLVATPVRRSMRPRSPRITSTLNEQVLYVDNLEQLSPTTKARAVLRKNIALPSE